MKIIIMCGGVYDEFKEPKQLTEICGEKLLERTIRLLKENGIEDIAISTNSNSFNYLNVEILNNKKDEYISYGVNENKLSKSSWLNAYYPINEPVCYMHGDVYFSDEANIKMILMILQIIQIINIMIY